MNALDSILKEYIEKKTVVSLFLIHANGESEYTQGRILEVTPNFLKLKIRYRRRKWHRWKSCDAYINRSMTSIVGWMEV